MLSCDVGRTGTDEAVQELMSEDLEKTEMEEHGGSNSSVRGVVAVLDDGQEMDRCSCDLVKVSCVPNIYLGRYPLCENHASISSVSPRNIFFQRGSPPTDVATVSVRQPPAAAKPIATLHITRHVSNQRSFCGPR